MVQITDLKGADRLFPFAGSSSATVRRLERGFRASLTASRRVADHRAGLANSGKLTAAGIAAEVEKFAKSEILPEVARGVLALKQARQHVKDGWARLKPAAADKTDLVGFFKRESIRDELRALSQEQRNTYLTRFDVDPEIALAAIEAADMPWHSDTQRFISAEVRTKLTRQLIAAEHAEAVAELDQIEQAVEYVTPTLDKARGELQSQLAMNDVQFQQAIQSEASKSPPIWIRRDGSKVSVVEVERATDFSIPTRPATAAEIENGVEFKDLADYRAAVAAAA